jgi:hypothetical protein
VAPAVCFAQVKIRRRCHLVVVAAAPVQLGLKPVTQVVALRVTTVLLAAAFWFHNSHNYFCGQKLKLMEVTMNAYRISIIALSLASLAHCADEPVNYSSPVGISLAFKSSDVVAGTIVADKNINTESGNPYASFVSTARSKIGRDPSRIEATKVTVEVLASSKQVSQLGQIFDGNCAISFVLNSGNVTIAVANRAMTAADTAGPVDMTPTFDSTTMSASDYAQLVGGSFKVKLNCLSAVSFASGGANVDFKATFTFAAYE